MMTPPPKLIARYFKALRELDAGTREPRTAMQVHFVSVCRGVALPVTAPERAYLAWRVKEDARRKREAEEQATKRRLARDRQRQPVAPSGSPGIAGRWRDPKPYARFIDEPVGTREDFKRDRAANFSASRRNRAT
jgi:hypothetical protein